MRTAALIIGSAVLLNVRQLGNWMQAGTLARAPLGGGAPREILRDIAATVPIYRGCTMKDLGDEGVRWTYPHSERPKAELVPVEYRAPVAV